MAKLYTIQELKNLKVGDKVITSYKDEDDSYKEESSVIEVTNDCIYFDNGYDFPFYNTPDVTSTSAIEDTGDFIFKVFKK